MVVASCTALSRLSGVLRVLLVGAVLGPTHLGDAYQVTNTLPNLVWYGFLAGSLVPALLVPVLVREIQRRADHRVDEVSRGFLGVAALAALVIAPLAVLGLPLLMQLATLGIPTQLSEQQVHLARLLVLLTAPQTFLYALIGTAGAVMYAHRRFALPSVGPALENIGVITVLLAVAAGFGSTGHARTAPVGELVLLGAGSTAAVALNAALQWVGARRCGVRLFPTWGWRDETVRLILHRTQHSVVAAALLAAQTLLILLLASRVTGGAVALQVALNFYVLPVALIATPIGLALLPELSALAHAGRRRQFDEMLARGLASVVFLAAPAAVGYVLMAAPVARVVAAGRMGTATGHLMIAGSLAALAVGLVGQSLCFVATQGSYSRGNTRTPLGCMAVQALLCLLLCGGAVVIWDGPPLVTAVAAAYGVATLAGGLLLVVLMSRSNGSDLLARLLVSGLRVGVGIAAMAVPVRLLALLLTNALPGRVGDALALTVGSVVGLVVYVAVERLLRSPELAWWVSGLRRRRTPEPEAEELAA